MPRKAQEKKINMMKKQQASSFALGDNIATFQV